MKRNILAVLLSVGFFLMGVSGSSAEETKFELNPQFSVKEVLMSQVGKRVSVKTDAGEALEGTITKVGDQLLHISKLSGKDFYDAVVRIDKITYVVLKVR
jgi:small nuclear ribonucleoprotein (snRNP)-like protein